MAKTTCVHIMVQEEHIEAFINATIENHFHSIKETGNLRFDVCQDPDNPCKFMLYEAYIDAASAAAHKESEHYKKWRDVVAPYMAQPRQGVSYTILAY